MRFETEASYLKLFYLNFRLIIQNVNDNFKPESLPTKDEIAKLNEDLKAALDNIDIQVSFDLFA